MKKIIIEAGGVKLSAALNDSETAKAIHDILPIEGTANVWGDEIYFSIPLHLDQAPDAIQEDPSVLKKVSGGEQIKVRREE